MLDFIERYFGISPDGGNGSTEFRLVWAMIILLIVVSALLLAPRAK